MLAMGFVKENIEVRPCLMVGGLKSPLYDVLVGHCRMFQEGDPFLHHHGISNRLPSLLRELSPLFQLFDKSGYWFRGVVSTHHLHGIFF